MPAVSPCAAASLPCQKRRFLASVLPFRRSRCYQPRRETVSMRSLPFALLAAGLLAGCAGGNIADRIGPTAGIVRSEEHTSELQSLMRISYAVFCLKKKKQRTKKSNILHTIQCTRQ